MLPIFSMAENTYIITFLLQLFHLLQTMQNSGAQWRSMLASFVKVLKQF
jgi:hypothetical protein